MVEGLITCNHCGSQLTVSFGDFDVECLECGKDVSIPLKTRKVKERR